MSLYLHQFNRVAALSPLELAQRLALDVLDEAQLADICSLSEQSPTAQQALRWAVLNGLRVGFGTMAQESLGHYNCQTGRITLSPRLKAVPRQMLRVLTHEIRHAWQDNRGFLAHYSTAHFQQGNLAVMLAQTALCEADAKAVDLAVTAELRLGPAGATAYFGSAAQMADMRNFFLYWFERYSHMYGTATRGEHRVRLTMAAQDAPACIAPTGIDPYDHVQVVNLGRGFTGNRNYLAGLERDAFARFILAPEYLLSDHNLNNAAAQQESAVIRKVQLRNRLKAGGTPP